MLLGMEGCFLVSMSTPLHLFFFFNDTATTEIYTLSLHDALPIFFRHLALDRVLETLAGFDEAGDGRSEEHTSELQSQSNLVCRLLLEKKKHSTNPVRLPFLTAHSFHFTVCNFLAYRNHVVTHRDV